MSTYSSTTEVKAYTRHLLDGETAFNSTTRPTSSEVTKFLTVNSAILDGALAGIGLSVPVTNTTGKLICDDWVTQMTVRQVELTQRGTGYNDSEGSRTAAFPNPHKSAQDFAKAYKPALIRLGVSESVRASDGLQYTGLEAPSERADITDTTLEQPVFWRHQFEADTLSTQDNSDEEDDD